MSTKMFLPGCLVPYYFIVVKSYIAQSFLKGLNKIRYIHSADYQVTIKIKSQTYLQVQM